VCPKYKFFDTQDLHLMNFAVYSLLSPEAKFLFKFISDFKLSVKLISGKCCKVMDILLYIQKTEM
jgi:hypothetical protein